MEHPVVENTVTQGSAAWTASSTIQEPQRAVEAEKPEQHGPSRGTMIVGAIILAIALAAAVVYGIHSRSDEQHELKLSTQLAAVPTVTVVHPVLGSKAEEVVLPGNTEAFIDTSIYARTSGYLKQWFVDIGAHVRAGELLAIIDAPELDQQLQQAQADLKSVEANQQLAETTNVRWQGLVSKHAVSQQEADQVASDLAAKQAATAASEANVRRLQQLQSYERVTAPFDGVITARSTDVGALINAGSASEPHELFHLAQVGKLRVFVAVPEVYAESVHDGEQVDITQDTDPGHIIHGTVTRNSNAISQASRTLNVEVDVDNAGGELLPGAYVFVHMKLPAGTNTVTIPSNALLFRAQGLQVGVVRDGHVQLVPITVGHDFGNTVEVTSGLTPQDVVILDPSDSLMSGMPVEVGGTVTSRPAQ
jgi:RND family efflux transporter MFP subunit